MKSQVYPSQQQLQELLYYKDGNLIPKSLSTIIYNRKDGYQFIDRLCFHRLVWIFHNGEIPNNLLVDHIDGNPSNNNIINLQLVTKSQNAMKKKQQITNTSGITGVTWNIRKQKWISYITIMNKRIHLGCYIHKEDAIKARKDAEKIHFGEFQPI